MLSPYNSVSPLLLSSTKSQSESISFSHAWIEAVNHWISIRTLTPLV